MASNRMEIGKRIRNFRINNNLTQAQFAESLNVSTNFISEIENGKKSISQDTLCRICEAYHLSADYLLFGKTSLCPSPHTLFEFLSSLSLEDIPTVIDYLEAAMKIKKLDMKNPLEAITFETKQYDR